MGPGLYSCGVCLGLSNDFSATHKAHGHAAGSCTGHGFRRGRARGRRGQSVHGPVCASDTWCVPSAPSSLSAEGTAGRKTASATHKERSQYSYARDACMRMYAHVCKSYACQGVLIRSKIHVMRFSASCFPRSGTCLHLRGQGHLNGAVRGALGRVLRRTRSCPLDLLQVLARQCCRMHRNAANCI